MTNQANVIFLHIPKTAGQSVHSFLVRLFGPEAIGPARVNEQLILLSVPEIRAYRVFSGHMDWALLDCVERPRFVFTVLRDPVDRILSFYFFLRREAQRLSAEELRLPQNQGKHAALHLSCDDYFCGGGPMIRTFLDNHYDNFYTYYFAGRTFDARQRLLGQQRANPALTEQKILDLAFANLTVLDAVYPLDGLGRLEEDLCRIAGGKVDGMALQTLRINRGDNDDGESRMDKLRELGATARTFDRIKAMTRLDQLIWSEVRDRAGAAAPAYRRVEAVGGERPV